MRWHMARQERLAVQKQIREAGSFAAATALERLRTEAKRRETRALQGLAKECAKAREGLVKAEDGVRKPKLAAADVIDI